MAGDRVLEAVLRVQDLATAPTLQFKNLLESISDINIKLNVTDDGSSKVMNQAAGSTKNVDGAMKNVSNTSKNVKSAINDVGENGKSAFNQISSAVKETTSNVGSLIASFTAMAAGGALAGASYVAAQQSELMKRDVIQAGDTIRAWGLKKDQMKEAIKGLGNEKWTSEGAATKTLSTSMVLGQNIGLKGTKALDIGKAAEMIAAAKNYDLGGMSGESLVQQAIKMKGELPARSDFKKTFELATMDAAKAMGSSYAKKMKTALGRAEIMRVEAQGKGDWKGLDMKKAMDEQPWIEMQAQVGKLNKAIGVTLIPTLSFFTSKLGDLFELVRGVPFGANLIGAVAIFVSLAGAAGLVFNVMNPMYQVMKNLGYVTKLQTVYTWALTTANTVSAAVTRMLTVNTISDVAIQNASTAARLRMIAASIWQTAVIKGQAISTWAVTAAQWAWNVALSANPIGLLIIGLAAVIGILYLVEQKTHLVTKAIKAISGAASGLYSFLTKSGSFKMILDFVGMAMFPMLKPLLMIAEFVYKLFTNSNALNKLFEIGTAIWNKILNAISTAFININHFVDWINGFTSKVGVTLPGGSSQDAVKKTQSNVQYITPGGTIVDRATYEKMEPEVQAMMKAIIDGRLVGSNTPPSSYSTSSEAKTDTKGVFGSNSVIQHSDDRSAFVNTQTGETGKYSPYANGGLGGYVPLATGTDYVPRTAPYLLHKGEKVTPASQNHGGDTTINVSTPVHIGSISNGIDINKLIKLIDTQSQKSIKNALAQRRG